MNILIKTGYVMSWTSFIVGTFLLIMFLILKDGQFLGYGLVFLYWAFHLNSALVIFLLLFALFDKKNKQHYFDTIIAMLFNIPIAFVYLIIVMAHM